MTIKARTIIDQVVMTMNENISVIDVSSYKTGIAADDLIVFYDPIDLKSASLIFDKVMFKSDQTDFAEHSRNMSL